MNTQSLPVVSGIRKRTGVTAQDSCAPYLESAQAAGDAFVNVSSASGMPNISADSRVTAIGANLAQRTEASGPPYANEPWRDHFIRHR